MPLTHTLDTLNSLDARQKTHYFGVIGHPIEHSLSPLMHNAGFRALTQHRDFWAHAQYIKIDIKPDSLEQALKLLWDKGFYGLNLTMPHKILAMDFIKSIDAQAKRLGAVNTLTRTQTGFKGFNTDGPGLLQALAEELILGNNLSLWPVIILGAGGAARAAAVTLLDAGCPYMVIFNRSASSLATMRAHLNVLGYGQDRVSMRLFTEGLPKSLPSKGLAIQAISGGITSSERWPIDPSAFPNGWQLYDTAYTCKTSTGWVNQARALGYTAADGLSMLLHQGALALQIWAKQAPPLKVMKLTLQQVTGRV